MSSEPAGARQSLFPTTRWTLIQASRTSPEARREALAQLLGAYWRPLYAFVRRQGLDAEEARDAVQGLCARLLEHDFVARVNPEKGRLRAYLLTAARNHLASEHERAQAARRGGGAVVVPLEPEDIERLVDDDASSPEDAFHREWAVRVMERALQRLRAEYEGGVRRGPFALVLQFFRPGAETPSYRDAAATHDMTLPQLKTFLHRARVRYRELVREEVIDTVDGPEAAEAELAELLRVLRT
ncbi:MAG: sigma-70 family RNA polymerase sigma factor [Myxococcaceae bacterium]|nr:sigma-70 family RNA polymerase sigma factor [Myxococcaceae bacterium]MCI0672923.1 sigma-70 family RNA polymerase sigma factor [Myxococcaceae bacterium]